MAPILDEVERLEREQRWPEALDVARRADAVLAGTQAEGDRASRARARQTVADLEMVARLEEVRVQGSELSVEPGGRLATRETTRRYQEVFRDYGVDVGALPAAEAVARLRLRVSVAAPLAAALDHWWEQTGDAQSELRGRLLTVASAIDSDPWRSRLRAAVAAVSTTARPPRPPGNGKGYRATAAAIPGVAGLGLEESGARDPPAATRLREIPR